MRAYANNSVTVSKREVEKFAARWPCFGAVRAMWFAFDRQGDLVDLGNHEGMDEAGVSALADDAKEYLTRKLEQRA